MVGADMKSIINRKDIVNIPLYNLLYGRFFWFLTVTLF